MELGSPVGVGVPHVVRAGVVQVVGVPAALALPVRPVLVAPLPGYGRVVEGAPLVEYVLGQVDPAVGVAVAVVAGLGGPVARGRDRHRRGPDGLRVVAAGLLLLAHRGSPQRLVASCGRSAGVASARCSGVASGWCPGTCSGWCCSGVWLPTGSSPSRSAKSAR